MTQPTRTYPFWYGTVRGFLVGTWCGVLLLASLQHWHVVPAPLPNWWAFPAFPVFQLSILLIPGAFEFGFAVARYRRIGASPGEAELKAVLST